MNQLRERIKMRFGMKMRREKKLLKGKKDKIKVNNSFSVDEGRAFSGTISNNNNGTKRNITSESLIKIELGVT